jgi:hypothetical protein
VKTGLTETESWVTGQKKNYDKPVNGRISNRKMNSNLNTINHSNISYYLAFVDCENENGTNCTEVVTNDAAGHFHPTLISEYTLRYGLWGSVFLWFVHFVCVVICSLPHS